MKSNKRSSLFSRLMFSVALPEIVIFSIVAIISYIQLKDLFNDISKEKVKNFQDELMSIIEFQDVSLSQLSRNLDHNSQHKMKALRFQYFNSSDSIETANLERIRDEIGMNRSDDIYIINRDGVIVNTTFPNDLNFNLFTISKEFKDFLEGLFYHDYYTPQPMSLETNTRKFKKYIYQSSRDHKYIIQLGFYSTEADKFNDEIGKRLKEIENNPNDIESIDLILASWKPFSLYKGKDLEGEEVAVVQEIFELKKNKTIESEDTKTSYTFFERGDNKAIDWKGILKVVYDKKQAREIMISSLIQKVSLFGFGMILLFVILYFNVLTIVRPIHHLSRAARKLGDGDLQQRTLPEGTREMVFLADSFNLMAENLEKSHMEITKKNEEITSSINYAKRIQEAILPPNEEVARFLADYFIYYRPKDIVAGDFYWFEYTDKYIFIAAADCTGHGVPGAMVSVVCSNALNQAVKELKLTEPAKILDAVREQVLLTFEKSQHDVKDGMDICFCRIDLKAREVVYSGAQNSLYRVTKVENHPLEDKSVFDDVNVLLEYKADKQPIGRFTMYKPFSQTKIQCLEGDCIYLFTDGFADQFGGPDNRKFMYKPFKKLLLSINSEDMANQEEHLDKAFLEWKLSESQVDDVCVIGIRMT